jgi:hypothetical protein
MRALRSFALLSSLLAVAVLATAPAASAATPPAPTLWLHGVAGRAADGTLTVTYAYRCQPRYGGSRGYAIVSLTVRERLGGGTPVVGYSPGGDAAYLVCDARPHQGAQSVLPVSGAFQPGSAFLRADVLACPKDEINCAMPTQRRVVAIVVMDPA